MMTKSSRESWLRRGRALALITIVYNAVEGVLAVAFGIQAESVALTGFGADSFIEVTSAAVLAWRLHRELTLRADADSTQVERIELRASRIAGSLLLALGALLLVESVRRLMGMGETPDTSRLGMILTSVSILLMPLLARAKLVAAARLNSPALRADAMETVACIWLSVTTLVGLGLNAWQGWWWADPVAALVLVPLIAKEGLEAVRGGCCACGEEEPSKTSPAPPIS
ncbi:MAG: hypothetical protein DHS20C15_03880 [Planctomycetota bacterium]|nr:MAG: hypothetical protein DHS20C15_03880 [Planctomycetota bacterium]